MNIAYMSFAVQNSYDAPMLAAAQAVAATDGATLKVFDANNSPQTQYNQLQTVINSGQYNGIITQPIFGTGLTTLVKDAIAKGIKVVNMDQILGPDLSTDQPQVTGLSANVTFVPTEIGTKLGQQVVAACASKNLNPCKIGYLYDIKASSLDEAIYGAFTAAIKGHPVTIATTGQSFFTPTTGLAAVETMLQAQPGLSLIVGSDQGIEGAMTALSTVDKADHVLLVGYGASAAAVAGITLARSSLTSPRRPRARDGSPSRPWSLPSRPARTAAPSTRWPASRTPASSPRPTRASSPVSGRANRASYRK